MPEAKPALMDVSDWGRRLRRGMAQLGRQRVAVAVLLLATALCVALFSWQIPLRRPIGTRVSLSASWPASKKQASKASERP